MSALFEPCAPENVGLSSAQVLQLLDRLEQSRLCLHGMLVVKDGQIAAEGYWSPFSWDRLHRMYSVSKSVVSLAVGLMIGEGKLRLTDGVAKFFPDKLPDLLHPYLQQTTVRDLLVMATPHTDQSYTDRDGDWVHTFFHTQPSHPPGLIYHYDTAGTVVLCSIVERLAGMPFLEYMRPRLLDPIGFSQDARCIKTPEGTSWGGSGVLCTLRDIAKLGYVCMHGGRWADLKLLPEDYVRAATSRQIDNSHRMHPGYGYQIWMIDGGFMFNGMGSQYVFCFPDRDLIVAFNGDTQLDDDRAKREVMSAVYDCLVHVAPQPATEDRALRETLQRRLNGLTLLPALGEMTSPWADTVRGATYRLDPNPMGIRWLRLDFSSAQGALHYENATGPHEIRFAFGRQQLGKFPESHYYAGQIGTCPGAHFDCAASAAWIEPHTLQLYVRIIDECFGTCRMTLAFRDNQVALHMQKAAEWFLDEYEGFAGGTKCAVG